jgi:hypothetical protein
MLYFEQRWAYFAGFGFPCTALTFWFPQFIGGGLFALLFPLVRHLCLCLKLDSGDKTFFSLNFEIIDN